MIRSTPYNKQYFLSVQGTRQCFAYICIVVKQFAANEMKVLSALAVSFCPTFPFAMVSVRQVRYGKAVTEWDPCTMYFFCNSSSAACAKFHNFCERLALPVLVWCLPVTCHSYRAINKPNLRFPPHSAHSVGMEHRLLSRRQTRSRRPNSIYFYGAFLVHFCIGDTFCGARLNPRTC